MSEDTQTLAQQGVTPSEVMERVERDHAGGNQEWIPPLVREQIRALGKAGFAIVPREPTGEIADAMRKAFNEALSDSAMYSFTEELTGHQRYVWACAYKAMLEASEPAKERE